MPRAKRPKKLPLQLSPPGSAPGLVLNAPCAEQPVIKIFAYSAPEFVELPFTKLEDLTGLFDRFSVVWLDIDGLGDAEFIKQVGKFFGFHRLALEDVVNVNQRPKMEQYGEHHFIVTRMLHQLQQSETEQLSIFVGSNFVVTFQEKPGDCLDPVRDRIRGDRGRIRKAGPDYLLYALLDAVIDAYFPLLEIFGERMDDLEDEILDSPRPTTIARIHDLKRELLTVRRTIWPLREVINSLIRDANPMITEETRIYLRDCYDHVVRIIDLVENFRELAADLMDLYLSMVSFKMNEVMKVLTIIATIFIPLTFIVGIYGMNFDYMPELRSHYGYPLTMAFMGTVVLFMLAYFRRKGWIGRGSA